ncbi:MAG: DUF2752 domain-containing protein [Clostridiales bacterium]|nr:DUF2752 domain-containing protein [Clostridiales bacterium]
MQTNEDIFYKLGKIALLPGVLGAVFLRMIGREGIARFPGCQFRRILGIYCPGCGGTRAVYYLAGGNLVKAFCCHPAVVFMAVVYVIFMITCFYRRHLTKKQYPPIKIERYVYAAAVLVLLQFVIKNVLLFAFGWAWI